MDKALNQLSVPLGQLREEVMVRIVLVCTSHCVYACVFVEACPLMLVDVVIVEPSFLCEWGD